MPRTASGSERATSCEIAVLGSGSSRRLSHPAANTRRAAASAAAKEGLKEAGFMLFEGS
jgi:hypothetical protein